jgi:hypothetical protein
MDQFDSETFSLHASYSRKCDAFFSSFGSTKKQGTAPRAIAQNSPLRIDRRTG